MRLQSFTSKENIYYSIATIGAGLVTARYLTLPSKAVATVSLITGSVTSIGRGFIDEDSSKIKKGITLICSFAASFFAAMLFLHAYYPTTFLTESVAIIIGSNLVGQAITAVLLNTALFNPFRSVKTLQRLSGSEIASLYEKYENDKEAYQSLSPLMQLLLYNQVFSIGKKLSTLPALPTEEDILALTDEEVIDLHSYENFIFTEDCPAARRLLVRFFELNLTYDVTFSSFMKDLPLPLPSTPSELRLLSSNQIQWLEPYFQTYPDQGKLDINLQWDLYQLDILPNCIMRKDTIPKAHHCMIRELHKYHASDIETWISYSAENQQALKARFQELKLKHPFPCHPETAKEVEDLSRKWIHYYHQYAELSLLTEDAQNALMRRFFYLNLCPPGTKLNQPWTTAQLDLYSYIDFPFPKTKDTLFKFGPGQKLWIFPKALTSSEWQDLSFSMQALIFKECFNAQTNFNITFSMPKEGEIVSAKVPKKMARLLYQQFVRNEDQWKSLPLLAQWNLNQKVFHKNSCPSIPLTFDPKKLPRGAGKYASEYYLLFESHLELWDQLTYSQQYAFNEDFSERCNLELPETHLSPYRIC